MTVKRAKTIHTQGDIQRFLQRSLIFTIKRHVKVQQAGTTGVAIFLRLLVDGAESSPIQFQSQINTTILTILYRYQVIQLVA